MSDTMLMFKPDCLGDPQSGFGELLFEAMRIGVSESPHGPAGSRGWTMKFGVEVCLTRNMAEKLYAEHAGKPFYERLVGFASSGPSFVSVWSCDTRLAWEVGRYVVSKIRAARGRSDLDVTGPANLMHGSAGPESASREVRWALRCMVLQSASFREEE